ncbi:MAG TPA: nuclear transport factor 2 family protein [Terriglobales bacterium]
MNMKSCVRLSLTLLCALSLPLLAQNKDENELPKTILHEDAVFWDAYNRCDVETMSRFLWSDVEFYHDKGGPTIGFDALVAALKNGLCGNPNSHLRREAVPGTVKVFPLQKNGVTYGAVLLGEHYFYVNDKGKPEYRDGLARFFHVWLLKDGTWKMARIVSYDHKAAP